MCLHHPKHDYQSRTAVKTWNQLAAQNNLKYNYFKSDINLIYFPLDES
jgi:hypothetical protein